MSVPSVESTAPAAYPVTDRSRVRLFGGRGIYARKDIAEVVDLSLYGVVSYVIDGQPFATPTIVWREGDDLYWHGSAGSRMLKAVSQGIPVCVNFTLLDGFVLSRLASAHTLNYRSVMAYGRPQPVESLQERQRQLKRFLDSRFPGRWDEVRQPSLHELHGIIMVRMPIEEASLKRRAGPPADGLAIFGGEALYRQACWAGEVPLNTIALPARPASRLHVDVGTPSYIDAFARNFRCATAGEVVAATPTARVKRAKQVAKSVVHIRLEADTPSLPRFEPGAHVRIGVVLPDRTWDTRSYTMVDGDPAGHWCEIAVLREHEGKGGSRYVHDALAEGSEVRVLGGGNDFPVAPDTKRAVLVAGGIGVTPILAMARHFKSAGVPMDVHYSARGSEAAAFREELAGLAGAAFRFHDTAGGRRLRWAEVLGAHEEGKHLYLCGPSAMVDDAVAAAAAAGYPAEAIHHELFKPPAPRVTDKPVRVHLGRTSSTLDVKPGTSILDAVLAAGVRVPHSCKRGECGECAVKVTDGKPSHRDHVLRERQRAKGVTCICVSWADSDTLTLDL